MPPSAVLHHSGLYPNENSLPALLAKHAHLLDFHTQHSHVIEWRLLLPYLFHFRFSFACLIPLV